MCDNIRVDPFQCRGYLWIPDTWSELFDVDMMDDWNQNILCVIAGLKKVALTDYYSITNPDTVEEYYKSMGGLQKHQEIIDLARDCGVKLLVGKEGTHYYYAPGAKRNAELLMELMELLDGGRSPEGIMDIQTYRSLLLGYSGLSIVLYKIYHRYYRRRLNLNEDNYMQIVDDYSEKFTPIIIETREIIESLGGVLFDD